MKVEVTRKRAEGYIYIYIYIKQSSKTQKPSQLYMESDSGNHGDILKFESLN